MPLPSVVTHPSRLTLRRRLIAAGVLAFAAAASVGSWALRAPGPADLGKANAMRHSGLAALWKAGNVVVLVRHGERCDRSDSACLGDADGITVAGSHVASQVGDGLQALGMEQAQVFTSPLTRTRQTAMAMFGQAAATQDWLSTDCDKHMLQDVVTHKQPGLNQVLITHSECINALEEQAGLGGGDSPGYASALFVSVDSATGAAKVMGYLNASEWPRLLHHLKG